MEPFSIKRGGIGNYLSIDLKDLNKLGDVREFLEKLESYVHHVSISSGKRDHLTVYLTDFAQIEECEKEIKKALDEYLKPLKGSIQTKRNNPNQIGASNVDNIDTEDSLSTNSRKISGKLDSLPVDKPIVFISYSQDNQDHKSWVKKLSEDLSTQYDVHTILDQDVPLGTPLIDFMKKGIKSAHRVLIIGTPEYPKKINENKPNGVVFEDSIIQNEMYTDGTGNNKFIPILRKGNFKSSFPSIINSLMGLDFSDDAQYDNKLKELAEKLWNEFRSTNKD